MALWELIKRGLAQNIPKRQRHSPSARHPMIIFTPRNTVLPAVPGIAREDEETSGFEQYFCFLLMLQLHNASTS